jgi:hypothetical protein
MATKEDKFIPLPPPPKEIDLVRGWKQVLKNKSTVHGEIFGVRAYTLHGNTALSQATGVRKKRTEAPVSDQKYLLEWGSIFDTERKYF